MIICYTVPEIWRMTDVIVIFHWGYFLPFYPPNSPKNIKFKIMKKPSGDINILQKCTKNHDHMLYCSCDMACDRCNYYFSFWAIFWPFTPITAQKMKISKTKRKLKMKMKINIFKKYLEISSFYIIAPKIMIICYNVPETWHVTDVIVTFHFGLFSGLFFIFLPSKKLASSF